ncbi:nucleocapsid protein [Anopheles B virus]|uniref:Nucleoprotein n=1 Tax=Anopheles B virus TaxID=35308 RepID=C1JJF3_9VIRU|nr:nucleocapsid protein [Anopheles B virus]YP_010840734.1 N [Anopheles B virus] [Anopheles B virus]ACN43214.1 nucleocapsid protein [Anopheles B virus]QLA46996.1 N [Anopheles B virus] [Anopheles B virus]
MASQVDFAFEDTGNITQSDFIPDVGYTAFCLGKTAHLSLENIKIFFLNAGKLKQQMKTCSKTKIKAKFGTLEIELVNTLNRSLGQVSLQPNDVTLHRASAYLARKALELYREGQADFQAAMRDQFVMPLAEVAGVQFKPEVPPELYIGFAPGAEFFMKLFKCYPLAIAVVRVKKGQMQPEFLAKSLRQRYAGAPPAEWMSTNAAAIKAATAMVEKYPMMKVASRPHIEKLLSELGLSAPTIQQALTK